VDPTQVDYTYCQACKVNGVFYRAWMSLRAETYKAFIKLTSIYREVDSFAVYGHNLGGVIATFAAREIADIFSIDLANVTIYTQGKPRIGNVLYANYMNEVIGSSVRVVHWRDRVPHTPQQEQGYFHEGEEYFCDQTMKNCLKCQGEDGQCSNSLREYNFEDHPIDKYFYP
jgi:predicted lipase